jgi:hypothetical protein
MVNVPFALYQPLTFFLFLLELFLSRVVVFLRGLAFRRQQGMSRRILVFLAPEPKNT